MPRLSTRCWMACGTRKHAEPGARRIPYPLTGANGRDRNGERFPAVVRLASMLAAIFGLVGVVVGSLTSGVVQWRLQRRQDVALARAALRLLASDFYTAQALIRPVRADGKWGPETTELPIEAFAEHRMTIAANLDLGTWKGVEGSILGLRHLNGIRSQAEAEHRSFDATELAHFERIGEWLDKTITQLEPRVEQ
jgi:hypothetical protein